MKKILQQELAHPGPARAEQLWPRMLGPAPSSSLRKSKSKPICRRSSGEIRWCQATRTGCGLRSCRAQTRAEDQGDHWIVNGAKIWTSYANHADWIFCLVRTEPDAPKHEGISFLLFDMASEGVSTSPIKLISGASPFCQTFFDNVEVPKGQLVGERGKGWTIAKRLLQHERQMISGIGGNTALGGSARALENLAKHYLGEDDGQISEAVTRQGRATLYE